MKNYVVFKREVHRDNRYLSNANPPYQFDQHFPEYGMRFTLKQAIAIVRPLNKDAKHTSMFVSYGYHTIGGE